MPHLEQVRELGRAEAHLDDDTVRRARQALTHEIARGGRAKDPVRARHRRWTGIGIGGLVAGVAATAVVVGSVLAPPVTPNASAAEVLNAAADVTVNATVLEPAAGQFIRIQEIATQTVGWTKDSSVPEGGFFDSRASATEAEVRQTRSLYVPADRSQDWVMNFDESTEILKIEGPDEDAMRAALEKDGAGPMSGVVVYPGGVRSETGVGAEGVDPKDVNTFHLNGLDCYYDEMPRDPAALVAWLRGYQHEYLSACAPPQLGEPLEFDLAPADLRVAMFRAMGLLDGAKVVKVEGDITTIALPKGGQSKRMSTVDIDTRRGLLVGRGTVDDLRWSSRINISVIDAIPASVKLPRN